MAFQPSITEGVRFKGHDFARRPGAESEADAVEPKVRAKVPANFAAQVAPAENSTFDIRFIAPPSVRGPRVEGPSGPSRQTAADAYGPVLQARGAQDGAQGPVQECFQTGVFPANSSSGYVMISARVG